MMQRYIFWLILFFVTMNLALSQAPPNYYNSTNGLLQEELKTELHNIIRGHNRVSYSSIWTHVQSTDDHLNDGGTEIIVWDMYTDNPTGAENEFSFGSEQCGTFNGEGQCYNREHTFPRSWWGGSTSDTVYTDLHQVIPVDGYTNTLRSNYPFGIVDPTMITYTTGNGSKVGDSQFSLNGYTANVFEPIDEYKGDIARMMFYMVTRYEHEMISWENESTQGDAFMDGTTWPSIESTSLDLLLSWHLQDPVSQKEIDRNNAVFAIQGNRNPFIDNPNFANNVWGVLLPVKIVDFGVTSNGIAASLSIELESEGGEFLSIEESYDGIHFHEKEKIRLHDGQNTFTRSFTLQARKHFYRLKIEEINETPIYSSIQIARKSHSQQFSALNSGEVQFFATGQYQVYSLLGNHVADGEVNAGETIYLSLPTGAYIIIFREKETNQFSQSKVFVF